jgi:hypothetical protein
VFENPDTVLERAMMFFIFLYVGGGFFTVLIPYGLVVSLLTNLRVGCLKGKQPTRKESTTVKRPPRAYKEIKIKMARSRTVSGFSELPVFPLCYVLYF